MPYYYFHLRDGEDVLRDADGRELKSVTAVVEAALDEARAIIADDALEGYILLDKYIDVENGYGSVIHRLAFADAVRVVLPNN